MRIPQPIGNKGSLRWIQFIVNENKELLNQKIFGSVEDEIHEIDWVSPREEDEYAEYRDQDFLKVLGLDIFRNKLSKFWPKSGPQWDALGKSDNGHYFLVEAKANIPEIISSCQAKSPDSIQKIESAITLTQKYLNVSSGNNWYTDFYQYANRLSHLYFLREICGVNAYLIFVYFCNDTTHIPTNIEQWKGSVKLQKRLMSLGRHKLQKYVLDLFVEVEEI